MLLAGVKVNSVILSLSAKDSRKQKLCGPDNNGRREVNQAVLQDPSAGLQWNLSQQQEQLLRSHKQLCLKQEQVKGRNEKAKAAAPEVKPHLIQLVLMREKMFCGIILVHKLSVKAWVAVDTVKY